MSHALFLSGGLADQAVAQTVLGRDVVLSTAQSNDGVPGLLVDPAEPQDNARLAFYSASMDTGPEPATIAGTPVIKYAPPPEPFDEIAVVLAAEIMSRFGEKPAEGVAQWMDRLRARAWSIRLAQDAPTRGLRKGAGDVAIDDAARPHDAFFSLTVHHLRPARFDGRPSDPMVRETFRGTDAALVLPYDPVTDRVLLVEQFRMGPFLRGDPLPWTLEPIAGMIDVGETPAQTAAREAVEEAGVTLTELIPVQAHYPTPGGTTDYFHTFVGLCDLSNHRGGIGGKADEQEDILSHVLSFADAMALLDSGEADAGPLVLLLYWLALNRDRLRAA